MRKWKVRRVKILAPNHTTNKQLSQEWLRWVCSQDHTLPTYCRDLDDLKPSLVSPLICASNYSLNMAAFEGVNILAFSCDFIYIQYMDQFIHYKWVILEAANNMISWMQPFEISYLSGFHSKNQGTYAARCCLQKPERRWIQGEQGEVLPLSSQM